MSSCARCGYAELDYNPEIACPRCGYVLPKLERISKTEMLYPQEKGILRALGSLSDPSKATQWIPLKRIALAFSHFMNRHYSTMATSDILFQLGPPFDGRKRRADGTYVLVIYPILKRRLDEIERGEKQMAEAFAKSNRESLTKKRKNSGAK